MRPPKLLDQLAVERCPHCNIHLPMLSRQASGKLTDFLGANQRAWAVYGCSRCGNPILAQGFAEPSMQVTAIWPQPQTLSSDIPDRAREYLRQAIESVHSPAGAVVLAASAVDSMLKAKSYCDGSLFSRIDSAVANHLLTTEMGAWAHEIRLDANDQRHADDTAPLPTESDARKSIEFAKALAEFLFVLPARVTRGRAGATT